MLRTQEIIKMLFQEYQDSTAPAYSSSNSEVALCRFKYITLVNTRNYSVHSYHCVHYGERIFFQGDGAAQRVPAAAKRLLMCLASARAVRLAAPETTDP